MVWFTLRPVAVYPTPVMLDDEARMLAHPGHQS